MRNALGLGIVVFILDQLIKYIFLAGFVWHSSCLSLVLAINYGVAFSLFAFLGEVLKYLQILFLIAIVGYFFWKKEAYLYRYPLALLFFSGLSNIFDRFVQGGVVDYVYWHCGFEFAIFNFADVMIDVAVGLFIWITWQEEKAKKGAVC